MKSIAHLFLITCVSTVAFGFQAVHAQTKTDDETYERHIQLDGQPNFRDLGGYVTDDKKKVRWRVLFRSGKLPELTDKDVKVLEDLKIKNVVDFLSPAEVKAHGKDRLPQGARSIRGPIDTDTGLAQTILEARQKADFSKVPPSLNPEIHRLLIRDKSARAEYSKLLRLAADPANHPIVFHCSHGIHRAGNASAIILSALGVPWETIRQDYLLSNKYREKETRKRLDYFRSRVAKQKGIPESEVDMTNFEAFYVLEGKYIDAMRDEIASTYGTMDNFFKKELQLTDEDLAALRQALLTN